MKYNRSPKIANTFMSERVKWCHEIFGPQFGEKRPKTGWHWNDRRWFYRGKFLYFKHEEDLTLFLLRWVGKCTK